MSALPKHLLLNGCGIYHFRKVVPLALRNCYNRREIKISLKTGDLTLATRRAQIYALHYDTEFQGLRRKMKDDIFKKAGVNPLHLKSFEIEDLEVQNGKISISGLKMDPNNPEAELSMLKGLQELLVGRNINDLPTGATAVKAADRVSDDSLGNTLLSVVSKQFIDEKIKVGAWGITTANENRQIYKLLIRIAGDIPVNSMNAQRALGVKSVLMKLPANMGKRPEFVGKSIEEILSSAKTVEIKKKLSTLSINKHIERISALFNWAVSNHYTDTNYFSTLKIGSRKQISAINQRTSLSATDRKQFFDNPLFADHKFKEAHHFWLPLLAIYSGARLNELASLCRDDIIEDQGVWVMDINANHIEKKLKTAKSARLIPLHSSLIELGFLKYINTVKPTKSSPAWIFPEITPHPDKGRSFYPSKFFSRYRKPLGWVGSSPKKDFHSFRHTVADVFKQQNVQMSIAAAILGHEMPGITYGTYGNAFLPQILVPAIEKVDFPEIISIVKPW